MNFIFCDLIYETFIIEIEEIMQAWMGVKNIET